MCPDPPTLPANLTTYRDVIEGNPIILRCPATGTPRPTITWFRRNNVITEQAVSVPGLYYSIILGFLLNDADMFVF